MYIQPFWVGFIAGFICGVAVIVAFAIYCRRKDKK